MISTARWLLVAMQSSFYVGAWAQEPTPIQTLPEVVVVGSPPGEYAVDAAVSATKSEVPILDTPVSVQAVSRAVMDDQKAHTLSDALKNVSGVQNGTIGTMGQDNLITRGFFLNHQVWMDGMRLCCANFDTDNLAAVELLKGPAGILYGRIEPGGMVNMVSKKPQPYPYRAIDVTLGSWEFRKTSVDLAGALNREKSLQFRLNATHLDTQSFIDYDWNRRVFIAPSFRYHLSADTRFDLQYSYKRDRGGFIQGANSLAVQGKLLDLPYGLNLNGPYSTDSLEDQRVRFDVSHKLNDNWKVDARLMFGVAQNHAAKVSPAFLAPDARTVFRNALSNNALRRVAAMNVDLSGTVDMPGMSHRLLAGIDYYRFRAVASDYFYGPQSGFVPSVDLYDPVQRPVNMAGIAAAGDNFHSKVDQQTAGIYLQDQIKVGQRWHWLLGARYDMASASMLGYSPVPVTEADERRARRSNQGFSPSLGALYKLRENLSLYASYAKSFSLYSGQSVAGELLPPTRSVQHEIGIKYSGPLSVSIAGYDLTKNNVPTIDPDPARAAFGSVVLTGQVRSRGIEIDFSGDITKRWSVIGSIGWNDTIVTQDNAGFAGKRVPFVTRSLAGLWSKYRMHFPQGHLDLAGGVFGGADTETSAGNTGIKLPGYAFANAMAAYTWKGGRSRYTAALNVDNLFDRRYYTNGISSDGGSGLVLLLPGSPRSIRLSLKIEFY